ncbi:MAG: endonuclease/exonuclease/phosphatase family metal-dependent hydrolase [Pseudohongiellaceae bacterium]|jgi:endonuclease/exonuclease/phosphatase family metal-dependent hydrolase
MDEFVSEFKICSFNLFNYAKPPDAFYELDNIYTDQKWAKKEKWLNKQLLDIDADIIGFQEVFSPDALRELVARHGFPYFETVEEPGRASDHIFNKPVVALASKFPIISAAKVSVDTSLISRLHIQSEFKFSRAPIRAEVKINGFATVVVYVVHLKSKRSKFDRDFNVDIRDEAAVEQYMLDDIQGGWASSIQRGTEAALIYQDICRQMRTNERPVVMIGDLNDTIESSILKLLVAGGELDRIGTRFVASLDRKERRTIEKFSLYDSFKLNTNERQNKRQPTHYFANQGSVLDYLLLSKDFDAGNDQSLAKVTNYQLSNAHLENPIYENDAECSDHAPVVITIEVRV